MAPSRSTIIVRCVSAIADNGSSGLSVTPIECAADFNDSNVLSLSRLFAYLNAWFAGDARADVDANDFGDVPDAIACLNRWFSGR